MEGAIYLAQQIRLPSGKDIAPSFEQLQTDEIWQALEQMQWTRTRSRYWVEWRREPMESWNQIE